MLLLSIALCAESCGSGAAGKAGLNRYGEPAIRAFASKINRTLSASQADVAIIARSGRVRSQLPRGVTYTHVAFALREPPPVSLEASDANDYRVYNLYQGAKGRYDRSYLCQDCLEYFAAPVVEPDIAIILPTPELQQRLRAVIHSPMYRALHNENYNLIANPWRHTYDNCVTHTLRVVAAALYPGATGSDLQQIIRTEFQPTPLTFGALQVVGSHFMPTVSLSDQEPGSLQTAAFDSLRDYMRQKGVVQESLCVEMDALPQQQPVWRLRPTFAFRRQERLALKSAAGR